MRARRLMNSGDICGPSPGARGGAAECRAGDGRRRRWAGPGVRSPGCGAPPPGVTAALRGTRGSPRAPRGSAHRVGGLQGDTGAGRPAWCQDAGHALTGLRGDRAGEQVCVMTSSAAEMRTGGRGRVRRLRPPLTRQGPRVNASRSRS